MPCSNVTRTSSTACAERWLQVLLGWGLEGLNLWHFACCVQIEEAPFSVPMNWMTSFLVKFNVEGSNADPRSAGWIDLEISTH